LFERLRQALRPLSAAERADGARSELHRVDADLKTIRQMLDGSKDSFHHAIAASTAHVEQLEGRRAELLSIIAAASPKQGGDEAL
jgi:hypothetical protein